MRCIARSTVAAVCLGALVASMAGAEATSPWEADAFSAEPSAWLAVAAGVEAEEGAGIHYLLQERHHHFDAAGHATLRQRFVVSLLNQAGVDGWSTWSASWRPWHQERPKLRIRVINADGTEHLLDPNTVTEGPVGETATDVLSDRLQLLAPLPGVEVGSVVEVETEVRDTGLLFEHGAAYRFYFALRRPVEKSRLVIEAPKELPLKWTSRLLPEIEPEQTESDGRVRLVFESGPRAAVELEALTPSDVTAWPLVGYATGTSWADVARSYSEIVDTQIGKPNLGRIVKKATRGARTPSEKVARLVNWLHQEIRYTGLAFSEAALVPRSPEETIERTYGDCKDKAALLVALLRQADIPAYLALLDTGPGQDVEVELPGIGLFDHAIVYVPELDTWIDATDPFSALGELPPADQGRLALVASPETTELRRIPIAQPGDNHSVETREIFLNAEMGGGRVVETTVARGEIGRGLRAEWAGEEESDLDEDLASYMESTYAASEFVGWQMADPYDLSEPFEMRLEAKKARVAYTEYSDAAIVIQPLFLLSRLPDLFWSEEEPAERRHDVALAMPYVEEWRYRIVAPDGYRPLELPENEERQFGPATLTRTVGVNEEGILEIDFRFDTGKGRLTPDEFAAMREGVLGFREEDFILLEFEQVGEVHLAVGEIKQALTEFERLIATYPERALPRTRFARALLEAGLGEAARREVQRAIELGPDYGPSHQTQGIVLQYDQLGRKLRGDFDRPGALAGFRKALELDPENVSTAHNLAILLEYDDAGFRYAPDSDLDEAIKEYRRIRDELEDSSLDENLVIALARSERYDEMLEAAEDLESTNDDALRLVALATAKSPAAAVRAARNIDDDAQNSKVLTAAQTLLQLRAYPEAAALFNAAARGTVNAKAILDLGETMRKTQRWEDREMDPKEPSGAIEKLMKAAFKGQVEDLIELGSRHTHDNEYEEDRKKLEQAHRMLLETERQSGTSVDVLLDLVLATMTTSLDGTPEMGYKAQVRWRLGQDTNEERVYLVPEDGVFKVLADSNDPSELGGAALRSLEAGDLAAARQWLDWARDEVAAARADDPLSGHPLARFWTRGDEGDAEQISSAALSLLAMGEISDDDLAALREKYQAAADEAKRGFEIALSTALAKRDEHEEVADLARSWLQADPDSEIAFQVLHQALDDLERWEALEEVAAERQSRHPDDASAFLALASVAWAKDDFESAEKHLQRRVDLGKAKALDYERLAWIDVLRGSVDQQTLDNAQQGASMEEDLVNKSLRTLSVVYAELGRSSEAREVMFQRMNLDGVDSPRPEEWYVLGRIAENYGVVDAARNAYGKIEEPEEDDDTHRSVHELAARRLAALDKG